MYRILIISLLVCCGQYRLYAQYQPFDNYFSIGYQYSNFGNSLSQSSIEMKRSNKNAVDNENRFTNDRNAYGLVLRYMMSNSKGLTSEFALGNKKVLSKMSYLDSASNAVIAVSTKQRMRYLTYGLHYSTGRWTFGTSLDLGIFSSLKREKGSAITGQSKWYPWFYTQKVLGSGITAKTPVVGWSLSAGFALTKFTQLRIYKQFTAFGMGAELSHSYFSMANWGIELAFTFEG